MPALLVLSAYAWLRRHTAASWGGFGSCSIVAGIVALGGIMGPHLANPEERLHLAILLVATLPVWLLLTVITYFFFCQEAPKRPGRRFFYYGATVLLVAALDSLYPFPHLWPRDAAAPAHEDRAYRSAPVRSEQYTRIARQFGLDNVKLRVIPSSTPTARVLSFSGKIAEIYVSGRLLELLDENEVAFVVAHELTHHVEKHYLLRLAMGGIALALFFAALAVVMRRWGAAGPAPPRGGGEMGLFLRFLPASLAAAAALALPVCSICRSQEIGADISAVRATGDRGAAVGALEKLERAFSGESRAALEAFSTHPRTDRRMAAIMTVISK